MSIAGINIAPSVLGSAVINIIGNTAGLRDAMNETRTQMYGMITIANAIGGKIAGAFLTPIFARRGMKSVAEAMEKATAHADAEIEKWQKSKPSIIPPPHAMMRLMDPGGYLARMAAHRESADKYKDAMEEWKEDKPDRKEIINNMVRSVAKSSSKMLVFATGIAFVGGALAKAIPYASEFTEQMNKVVHTFGLSTAIIMRGMSGANNAGLSRADYLRGVSTVGIELLGSGMSEKESAEMSRTLASRASDIASMYDIGVDQVLTKIQAGLAGFGRPLKELGIVITESRVHAKALAMGFKEVNGELTEEQKLKARAALILQLSQRAEGDFARTFWSYRNQTRILGAQWTDMMAELGKVGETIATLVLPIVNLLVLSLKTLAQTFSLAFKFLFDGLMAVGSFINKTGFSGYSDAVKNLEDEEKYGVTLSNLIAERNAKRDELMRGGKQHASHYDLASYAKHLQEAIFKNDVQHRQLTELTTIRQLMQQRKAAQQQQAAAQIANDRTEWLAPYS